MSRLITAEKSVIVAADVPDLESLEKLAAAVEGVPGISGFKLGFRLGWRGLEKAAAIIKTEFGPEAVIIYDHQKGANDIPAMGKGFAQDLSAMGIDAAILFPFTGPETQKVWTEELQDEGITVLTGGIMTHPKFLVSEGGYIPDDVPPKIYQLACDLGVRDFVVPGNKIEWVAQIKGLLTEKLGQGGFTLYAPGFLTQKGVISECGQSAGDNWHAIVGSGIYKQPDMRVAAMEVTSQII